MFPYKKLNIWNQAKDLAIQTYKATRTFPPEEKYAIGMQVNRAVVSISSNIAEGCSRSSIKEQIHFIEIAYGSLMETTCQLEISYELEYLNEQQFNKLMELSRDLSVRLTNYKNSLSKKL